MIGTDTNMFCGVPGPPVYPAIGQLRPGGGWVLTNADTEAYELSVTQYRSTPTL
jgi:hypothetical protein